MEIAEFCREIETYLCRKNDGHLIRIVGPSFDLVSGWAGRGVPLKVACSGIDRYFERYYRTGPRRRPVRIDFCEADVLDVFDEWRRATGVRPRTGDSPSGVRDDDGARTPSLPSHLQRAIARLTSARASGLIGQEFDGLIDRLSGELDAARARAGGVRGDARSALVARLAQADEDLIATATAAAGPAAMAAMVADADNELATFRARMTDDEYGRARRGAIASLVRQRFQLPSLRFS